MKLQHHLPPYNQKDEFGPFDIIGDVHGCFDEMQELLEKLGYCLGSDYSVIHPEGRKIIFVGDLVDRGPKTPEVLRFVKKAVEERKAFCVMGNHDDKLRRALIGNKVKVAHGLQESLDQLAQEPRTFLQEAKDFLSCLSCYYIFDQNKLVVTHAGIKEEFIGHYSHRIKRFCLYGDIVGKLDAFGFPVRLPWADKYQGNALIVYGHTPTLNPKWVNNTINIDTGCVFGGKLTALRYPEKTLVSVPARCTYSSPLKPLDP